MICCCSHVIVFCRCLPTAFSYRTASSHSHPGTYFGRAQTHPQAQQPHNRRHRQVLSRLALGPRVWDLSGCTADDSNIDQAGYSEQEEESVVSRRTPPDSMAVPGPSPWTQTRCWLFFPRKETKEVKMLSGRSDSVRCCVSMPRLMCDQHPPRDVFFCSIGYTVFRSACAGCGSANGTICVHCDGGAVVHGAPCVSDKKTSKAPSTQSAAAEKRRFATVPSNRLLRLARLTRLGARSLVEHMVTCWIKWTDIPVWRTADRTSRLFDCICRQRSCASAAESARGAPRAESWRTARSNPATARAKMKTAV